MMRTRTSLFLSLSLGLYGLLFSACDSTADPNDATASEISDSTDATPDELMVDAPLPPSLHAWADSPALTASEAWGLGLHLYGIELLRDNLDASPLTLTLSLQTDPQRPPLHLGPHSFFHVQPATSGSVFEPEPLLLMPGLQPAPHCLGDPCTWLVAWEPHTQEKTLHLAITDSSGRPWRTLPITLGFQHPQHQILLASRDDGAHLRLYFRAEAATPLSGPGSLGVILGNNEEQRPIQQAPLIQQGVPLRLKVYEGARPYLTRPECDTDLLCAPGAPNHPCAVTCACLGEDCPFDALAENMHARVQRAIQQLLGRPPEPADLAHIRIHYVFKRSLGGSKDCQRNGEIAAPPEAWRTFIAHAFETAAMLNARYGHPIIDLISPMNEINHPLQDGAPLNALGQAYLASAIKISDFKLSSACDGKPCCEAHRYLDTENDVMSLVQATLDGAQDTLQAFEADPALSPFVPGLALSLFLDTDFTDPFGDRGHSPSPIITAPSQIFDALQGHPLTTSGHLTLALDTYPGSWGAPWYTGPDPATEDAPLIIHYDIARDRILRADPVQAADMALTKALEAHEQAFSSWGKRHPFFLAEVGWSTFDGRPDAQDAFLQRLLATSAAFQVNQPLYRGLLWFRDLDRQAYAPPTWQESHLLGSPTPCSDRVLGPLLCTLDLLSHMENHWGLFGLDSRQGWQPHPSWLTFQQALRDHALSPQ